MQEGNKIAMQRFDKDKTEPSMSTPIRRTPYNGNNVFSR